MKGSGGASRRVRIGEHRVELLAADEGKLVAADAGGPFLLP